MKKITLILACLCIGQTALAATPRYVMQGDLVFNVKDYGAKGNGSTDDTAAIQAAINAALAVFVSSGPIGSGGTIYSQPTIYFPKGKYATSSTLNIGTFIKLEGNNSIFAPKTNTFPVMTINPQTVTIDGFQFAHGLGAISLYMGGVGNGLITVSHCYFGDQTNYSIFATTDAFQMSMTVRDSFFENAVSTSAIPFEILGGEWMYLDNVQVGSKSDYTIQWGTPTFNTAGFLSIKNSAFTPYGANSSGVWILNYGNVAVVNTRFGGENGGGYTIIRNYTHPAGGSAGPSSVMIEASQTYSANTHHFAEFFAIPNIFVWRNNQESTDSSGAFYFDTSVSTNDYALIGSGNATWDVESNGMQNYNVAGATAPMANAFLSWADKTRIDPVTLQIADKKLLIQINSGAYNPYANAVNVTQIGGNNLFGSTTTTLSATGAGAWTWERDYTTAMNGFSVGPYTAVFEINNITGEPLVAQFNVGDASQRRIIMGGKNSISVPFYYNGIRQYLGIVLGNVPNSQQVSIGDVRLFNGNIKVPTFNTIVYDTAAPSTLYWEKGDRVINSSPTAGQPKAWVCTVAGTPGTWVSEGNL